MIDYIILICIIQDGDSIAKNWQWTTWGKRNGKMKWFVNPYDLDGAFGINSTTSFTFGSPNGNTIGNAYSNVPAKYVYKYYTDDLKSRYAELRKAGIISYDTIFGLWEEWVDAIGLDNYILEYEKWDESPCNRNNQINSDWQWTGGSYVTYWDYATNWSSATTYAKDVYIKYNHRCYQSLQAGNIGHNPETETDWWKDVTYKEGVTYNQNDVVMAGYSNFYQFKALKETTNNPFEKLYDNYPHEGGVFDSIYRISKWTEEKIEKFDITMNYSNN